MYHSSKAPSNALRMPLVSEPFARALFNSFFDAKRRSSSSCSSSRYSTSTCAVLRFGFRISGFGFRVSSFGFRVSAVILFSQYCKCFCPDSGQVDRFCGGVDFQERIDLIHSPSSRGGEGEGGGEPRGGAIYPEAGQSFPTRAVLS